MDIIANVLLNGGLGLASFLALCFLGKFVLQDMKKSIDNNSNVLADINQTMILVKDILKKGDD